MPGIGEVRVNTLMLWSKINCVLQFFYWASIYLLKVTGGNTRWMCEVIYIVLVSLLLTLSTFHISHFVPKICDIALSFFVINIWFIALRGEFRSCSTYKMELFARIVYSFKSLTILTRNPHFKIFYGVLNLSQVFFQIYISHLVILLVYFINPLSEHVFSSIVCIHVERVLHSPFSISNFIDGIKLKFVAVMTFME